MKIFKSVFHKTAACIGCGVFESNCRHGAISFRDGLHIDEKRCVHCLQCHDLNAGCLVFDSGKSALVKQIGWDTATALGLILVNLVYNNPQIRWYVENLPVGERIAREVVEKRFVRAFGEQKRRRNRRTLEESSSGGVAAR